jgi:hypothetical protein
VDGRAHEAWADVHPDHGRDLDDEPFHDGNRRRDPVGHVVGFLFGDRVDDRQAHRTPRRRADGLGDDAVEGAPPGARAGNRRRRPSRKAKTGLMSSAVAAYAWRRETRPSAQVVEGPRWRTAVAAAARARPPTSSSDAPSAAAAPRRARRTLRHRGRQRVDDLDRAANSAAAARAAARAHRRATVTHTISSAPEPRKAGQEVRPAQGVEGGGPPVATPRRRVQYMPTPCAGRPRAGAAFGDDRDHPGTVPDLVRRKGNVVGVSDPERAPAGTAGAEERPATPSSALQTSPPSDRRGAPTKLGFGGVMRSVGFRRLLIGQTVSSLGDWVATLAFIAAAFALTSNQTAVAVVLILRLVPPIFAAPVGGVFADRFDRRLIMVTCDLSRAALIVLVPFVGIELLYTIAFVHECISLFFLPARDASVPMLVRKEKPRRQTVGARDVVRNARRWRSAFRAGCRRGASRPCRSPASTPTTRRRSRSSSTPRRSCSRRA